MAQRIANVEVPIHPSMRLSIHSSSSTAFPSLKVARVAEANPLKFIVSFFFSSIRGSDTNKFRKKIKNISDPARQELEILPIPIVSQSIF